MLLPNITKDPSMTIDPLRVNGEGSMEATGAWFFAEAE
jgi:hypothetical protein